MRLQDYLSEAFNYVAYFISPKGEIIRAPQTHIQQVVATPEKFGLYSEFIDHIYDYYGERKGDEGQAREQILISLLNQGWIRLRRSKNFWTAQLKKIDAKSKVHLSKWAGALLDGKLGYNEIDPYIELKILDINGRMDSSGLQQLKKMSEEVDYSNTRLYEISELEDRPLIKELSMAKKVDVKLVIDYQDEFKTRFSTYSENDERIRHTVYEFDAWMVTYQDGPYEKEMWVMSFNRGGEYETQSDTSLAETIQVFSGVKKSLEMLLKSREPELFQFEAEDDKHRKVYDKMEKYIKMKYGYDGQSRKIGGMYQYNFWKKGKK